MKPDHQMLAAVVDDMHDFSAIHLKIFTVFDSTNCHSYNYSCLLH
jgi:hypothetical protein